MSRPQQVSVGDDWRDVNIDVFNADAPMNFDTSTLRPEQPAMSDADVSQLKDSANQLKKQADVMGALRLCLENPVYNAPESAKDMHLKTILSLLTSISATEATKVCKAIYGTDGGKECLDVLMKYIYKAMAAGSAPGFPPTSLSTCLSCHEILVQIAGQGCIVRTMTDWRRV